MSSFTFNNERKEFVQIEKGWKRPTWAPLKRNFLSVPGYPGGRLLNTQTEMRILSIPVGIIVPDGSDLETLKEEIADWLITDQPTELIFDVEPNRTYLAVVDDTFDPDEFVALGIGTLKFICPMPYKLGPIQKKIMAIENGDLKAKFLNKGSVESNPIIDITVGLKGTFLDVWNGLEYFRLGYPVPVQTAVESREERILWDEMNDLTKWTPHTQQMGYIQPTGSFKVWQGYAFYADNYGNGTAWHGPVMTRVIPQDTTDFILDCQFTIWSTTVGQMGAVAVFLLGDNDEVMSMLDLTDYYETMQNINARLGVGWLGSNINKDNYRIIESTGGIREGSFNYFRGHLSMRREGNKWSAKVSKYRTDTEIDNDTVLGNWIDINNTSKYTTMKPKKIAVAVAKYGNTDAMKTAFIEDVKFYRINHLNKDVTPYIFDVGDKVQIDTERSLVTINGTNAIALKDIFSSFPVVRRGQNEIIVRPANVGIVELTYRKRFR
ncbi:phage tail family protein [Bacillus paramycoides]|uniref:distal tail protein Dit n=1 Tax=Bacillus paramycoides TaxID=2026194 RepID=UPI002E24A8D2|nr:distal tail protein Dit [Bacillus paramycoides]MED0983049.1 phage tail family protein [Bacillus paramycoides]